MTSSLITSEIQKLEPSAVIELFVVDATALGGDVLRFHAGTNALKQNVVWQGETYVRFPIEVSGFEFSGTGQIPRPKIRVSNVFSSITAILIAYNDLLGAKVTRKRTLAKYLDAVNFDGGVNPDADTTAEIADDVYFVDRKSAEDRDVVEFELAASIDVAGVMLPRRQIIQNICTWRYRGSECGYTGAPLWDGNDSEFTTSTTAEGQAVVDTRTAYRAAVAALEAAEIALTAAASAKGPACDWQNVETRFQDANGIVTPTYGVVDSPSGALSAYWDVGQVDLGATYRRGSQRDRQTIIVPGSRGLQYYTYTFWEIQRWAVDSTACTNATTAYTSALAARDAAIVTRDNALDDFNDAVAALPLDDPWYTQEKCGKRLSSCKLRFGENAELPFGGFPGAGLIK